jgi:hypothetical protein
MCEDFKRCFYCSGKLKIEYYDDMHKRCKKALKEEPYYEDYVNHRCNAKGIYQCDDYEYDYIPHPCESYTVPSSKPTDYQINNWDLKYGPSNRELKIYHRFVECTKRENELFDKLVKTVDEIEKAKLRKELTYLYDKRVNQLLEYQKMINKKYECSGMKLGNLTIKGHYYSS